ncbi:hypothetical protein ACIBCM_08690 [Streptomyces sp. NPDC051018]|uniref:hypothetical protein n=1 Tax=Streptomyces sp. NPDC051018 TaxID=3365639 RepID=UPI00378BCD67
MAPPPPAPRTVIADWGPVTWSYTAENGAGNTPADTTATDTANSSAYETADGTGFPEATEPPDGTTYTDGARVTTEQGTGRGPWHGTAAGPGGDAESTAVAAHLVTSRPSPWPRPDRVPLDIRSTGHTTALERLERIASGPPGRLREEYYRPARDGSWVRAPHRPPESAEPGLPRHALVRDDEGWSILHEDATGPAERARTGQILLRALVAAELAARGGVTVHASAATDRTGRAVLFLGDSGAGKSTLALQLARREGRLLSGDRTVLVPGPGGWWAVGAGLLPRFRWGTLEGLGLAGRVRGAALLRHGGASRRVADLPETPPKVVFTPGEAERVLGVRTADCAPLGRLVLISGSGRERPLVHGVTRRYVVAAVRRQVLPSDAGCLERPSRDTRTHDLPGSARASHDYAPWGRLVAGPPLSGRSSRDRALRTADIARLVREAPAAGLAWDPLRHRADEALDACPPVRSVAAPDRPARAT